MLHLPAESGEPDVGSARSAVSFTQPASAPVLISEPQVAFSTAAVLHPPRHHPRRVRTLVAAALGDIRKRLLGPLPQYPRRERSYFEAARMSRQMERL